MAQPRDIWTRLMVDPLADPIAVRMARWPWVTPNRTTGVAAALAVGSAAAFAGGQLRLGGALFIARFFFDCLDGKVARAQGVSSARGAVIDLAADVGGIALVLAALGWRLAEDGVLDPALPLALLASVVFYNWVLDHRKALAHRLDAGDGGADHTSPSSVPIWGAWVAVCRRISMRPVPWSVEVEIAALGLGPLLAPSSWLPWLLGGALAFYVVADLINLRRTLSLARRLDETPRPRTRPTSTEETHGRQ